jgi:hypothetical protein
MTSASDDEEYWAQTQSILDRWPTESTERSLRRSRRTRLLMVFGIALAASAVMAVTTQPRRSKPRSSTGALWVSAPTAR